MNMSKSSKLISALFYGFLFLGLFFAPAAKSQISNFKLLENLLNGSDKGFYPLGHEFSVFDGLVPETGRISFIMDFPFSNYGKTVEQIYTAQSYFAPLLINKNPEEPLAIVFCSSEARAHKRLEHEGYRWKAQITPGKGLAEKIQ